MFKIDLKKYDCCFITIISIVVIFGLFMVFSSSDIIAYVRWDNPYKFFIKQLFWVTIGFIVMFFTSFYIDYNIYKKILNIFYLLTLILLVYVLFFGKLRLGAKRWINIGGFFTIQPSELAKILVVIIISNFISKKKKKKRDFIITTLMVLVIIFLIAIEPDLGTPILIIIVCFSMLFCAGIGFKFIFISSFFSFLFIFFEIMRKPYRLTRFKDYLLSFVNIDYSSYQVKQSLNALGSGGLFGKGFGKSEMKLMYLPEAHTDFIFPVIGEELGFIGVSMLILFFVYFFIRGIKVSKQMPDIFSEYLCLGITFLIVFQAVINLSVALGILPAKGIPLPFISFGGTSLFITMLITGILINLSQYGKK
jgi:cell division protein FtsW